MGVGDDVAVAAGRGLAIAAFGLEAGAGGMVGVALAATPPGVGEGGASVAKTTGVCAVKTTVVVGPGRGSAQAARARVQKLKRTARMRIDQKK